MPTAKRVISCPSSLIRLHPARSLQSGTESFWADHPGCLGCNHISYLGRSMPNCALQLYWLIIHNHINIWNSSFRTLTLEGLPAFYKLSYTLKDLGVMGLTSYLDSPKVSNRNDSIRITGWKWRNLIITCYGVRIPASQSQFPLACQNYTHQTESWSRKYYALDCSTGPWLRTTLMNCWKQCW